MTIPIVEEDRAFLIKVHIAWTRPGPASGIFFKPIPNPIPYRAGPDQVPASQAEIAIPSFGRYEFVMFKYWI